MKKFAALMLLLVACVSFASGCSDDAAAPPADKPADGAAK